MNAVDVAAANAARIANGSAVDVTHLQGVERGTVLSSTRVLFAGEHVLYTVQFADGTISSWAAFRVQVAR